MLCCSTWTQTPHPASVFAPATNQRSSSKAKNALAAATGDSSEQSSTFGEASAVARLQQPPALDVTGAFDVTANAAQSCGWTTGTGSFACSGGAEGSAFQGGKFFVSGSSSGSSGPGMDCGRGDQASVPFKHYEQDSMSIVFDDGYGSKPDVRSGEFWQQVFSSVAAFARSGPLLVFKSHRKFSLQRVWTVKFKQAFVLLRPVIPNYYWFAASDLICYLDPLYFGFTKCTWLVSVNERDCHYVRSRYTEYVLRPVFEAYGNLFCKKYSFSSAAKIFLIYEQGTSYKPADTPPSYEDVLAEDGLRRRSVSVKGRIGCATARICCAASRLLRHDLSPGALFTTAINFRSLQWAFPTC